MPPKKEPEYEFPPESCGVCEFCKVIDEEDEREHQGVCFALPPQIVYEHGSVRPIVGWDSPRCVYFLPRIHA